MVAEVLGWLHAIYTVQVTFWHLAGAIFDIIIVYIRRLGHLPIFGTSDIAPSILRIFWPIIDSQSPGTRFHCLADKNCSWALHLQGPPFTPNHASFIPQSLTSSCSVTS